MDLIGRYLQAIKLWLPRDKRQDIIAEISEDLHSQVDDRERDLGRPLDKAELAALVKKRGQPMTVAASYLDDATLNPPLWLIYRFTLKVVLLWILTPLLLIIFIPAIINARHHAITFLWSLAQIWQVLIFATGMITFVFALVRKPAIRALSSSSWDPANLPALRDTREIPRFASLTGVLAGLFFVLWWIDLIHFPVLLSDGGDGLRIVLGPTPPFFYWLVVANSAACIAAHAYNLWRPWWTRTRAAIWLVLDCTIGVIAYLFLDGRLLEPAGHWLVVSAGAQASVPEVARLSNALNMGVYILLWSTMVIAALIVVFQDLRRLTASEIITAKLSSAV